MRDDIELLISTRVDDLMKLELALLFQQNPEFVDRVEPIARRLQRDPRAVEDALRALAETGVLERFELGAGKYILYSYTRDPVTRALLDQLSVAYHDDAADRNHIIRRLMRARR